MIPITVIRSYLPWHLIWDSVLFQYLLQHLKGGLRLRLPLIGIPLPLEAAPSLTLQVVHPEHIRGLASSERRIRCILPINQLFNSKEIPRSLPANAQTSAQGGRSGWADNPVGYFGFVPTGNKYFDELIREVCSKKL